MIAIGKRIRPEIFTFSKYLKKIFPEIFYLFWYIIFKNDSKYLNSNLLEIFSSGKIFDIGCIGFES